MKKIKEWIKREKFLSICILIIVALLLFMLVYSYFPSIETQGGNSYVIFGGWNPKNAEEKTLKGIVIFLDEAGKKHIGIATFEVGYIGAKTENFSKEAKNDILKYYTNWCSSGYDTLQTVEEAKRLGYLDFRCGYYMATAKWEYQGEEKGDWITLKEEYVRIYINEEIE